MSPNYADRYNHPLWQKKRLEVLERAQFKCERCGDAESQLHVHHHYYVAGRKPWQYDARGLSALCKGCHDEEHALASEPIWGLNPITIWEQAAWKEITEYMCACSKHL